MTKICYKCTQALPIGSFAKDSRAKSGLQSKCKPCDSLYRKLHASKIAQYKAAWNRDESNLTKQKRAAWKKANPGLCNANKAKRKAARLLRTPTWLTAEHFEQIAENYTLAAELQWLSNDPLQVDHILPLQGKIISGLHVPWNLQVITRKENLEKGNRHGR